jgi:hypothetical protein
MEIANIYPLYNQELYKDESFVMILAHLIKSYNRKNFNKKQFIILDNGLYEGAQVSTDIKTLIKLAKKSRLPISEIVIPDVFFNSESTKELFEKNLKYIKKYSKKYSFMFVAQSNNIKEFEDIIDYINNFEGLNLTVGIPKKAPFSRQSNEAINIYKTCKFPIHFLGLTDTDCLSKLKKVKNLIRSCDTSQICTMLKNHKHNILKYSREKEDETIDLKNDRFSNDKIRYYREALKNEL